MELKEKVSGDSGRNDILVRLSLDGIPFRSKYHTIGAGAVSSFVQSQFLDPGRVKSGEGRRCGDCGHDFPSSGISESEWPSRMTRTRKDRWYSLLGRPGQKGGKGLRSTVDHFLSLTANPPDKSPSQRSCPPQTPPPSPWPPRSLGDARGQLRTCCQRYMLHQPRRKSQKASRDYS